MVVEEFDGSFCYVHSWNIHSTFVIKVREEHVSIFAHIIDVFFELIICFIEMFEHINFKTLATYNFTPTVLSSSIAEELAPFEHCHVDEVSVNRRKKFPILTRD